jgi:ubiquinone biosynthesis protein
MSSSLDTVNENLRIQQVYSTLLNFGVSGVIDGSPLGGFRRAMQRWVYHLPEPVPRLSPAVRTRVLVESLGPTYVKFGQIVSSQANVLPDEWRTELDKLQNDVPPVPYEDIRRVIVTELGAPPEELYATFDVRPLAAASLGQVHAAVLHDGRRVAVKVQRPDLDRRVRADLGVAEVFGRYAERRSQWARQVGVRSMLEEFGSTLIDELDYYAEAYNMERLATNLAPIAGVHVPTFERALSSKRVLTQEFITGVKISDVEAMQAAGLDVGAVGEAALRAAMKMLLVDGVFHADPHPGNLIVNLDTGIVNFLDCGMVGELTLLQRAHLVLLLWTFVKGDVPAMGQQLRSISVPFRPVDDARFLKEFERRMSRYSRGSNPDIKLVMSAAMGVLRDNGLRLDPQLTLALKAMVQASAFFTRLAPADRPFTEAALSSVRDLAEDAVSDEAVINAAKKEATKLAGQALQELPDYVKGLFSWRDQVKRGKFTLFLDTSSLDKQVDTLRSIASMLLVALLVAGGMIGGALASSALRSSGATQAARVAEWVFFASVGLAVVLVLVFLAGIVRDLRGRRRRL